MGLGVGDPREIEVVGDVELLEHPWHFVQEDTFASRGQKLIYHGPLKPFENLLLRTPLVPWSYLASRLYHDVYWYPMVGRKRVQEALKTKWGCLFLTYVNGHVEQPDPRPQIAGLVTGLLTVAGVLWMRYKGARA